MRLAADGDLARFDPAPRIVEFVDGDEVTGGNRSIRTMRPICRG
jgi:hypothetical protein